MTDAAWTHRVIRGSAAEFHARALPESVEPAVWWFEVERAAIVLGSGQALSDLDLHACAERGIEVVRRRSGGGAVLLEPGDVTWADVILPADHRRWTGDVSSSAWWLGEAWVDALARVGGPPVTVHRGAMVCSRWSPRVCFAGLGGGEVVGVDGRKVVGISQRRTRAGARFQCAVYHHWRPDHHVPLLAEPRPAAVDLAGLVAPIDVTPDALRAAFTAALTRLA